MTPEQREARQERVSIMVEGGDVSENEANLYCNHHPDRYGYVEVNETQEEMF